MTTAHGPSGEIRSVRRLQSPWPKRPRSEAFLSRLDEIIETFQSAEREMRLELLLDFADRLPPLTAEYHAA